MRAVILAAALAANPGPTIFAYLDSAKNHPAGHVFETLGYPTSEGEIAGQTVYVWYHGDFEYFPGTTWTTGADGPYSASAASGGAVQLSCTIRIFTEVTGLVTHYDVHGNVGGCQYFADLIDRRLKGDAETAEPRKCADALAGATGCAK
jgi:hypothetical protein